MEDKSSKDNTTTNDHVYKFLVCLHGDYQSKYNFVATPRKFIISKLIVSTDEDPSLRIEIFAIVNLRDVATKLYLNARADKIMLKSYNQYNLM